MTSWQVAGARSGVAAAALLLFLPAARRGWSWRAALVGCAYAATVIMFVTANKLTTSAATIFLQDTAPLYLVLLGPLLLREKTRERDVALLGILAVGLVTMFAGADAPQATAPNPLRGDIIAAASGVAWARTIAGLRWLARGGGTETAAPGVVMGNLIACGVCLPFVWPLTAASGPDIASIVYLGVFQIGLAYVLLTGGIQHIPALTASLLLLLEPVLNPVWSWLVHGERPGLWTLAGGVLILGTTVSQAVLPKVSPADR